MPLCVAGTVLGTGDIAENKAFTGPLLGDLLSRGDPDHKQDLYVNRITGGDRCKCTSQGGKGEK